MNCHDCKKVIDAWYMKYPAGFFKCQECHDVDPVLRGFQPCEVYSRIVGYIRPVAQWNNGKKAEFRGRVEYANKA